MNATWIKEAIWIRKTTPIMNPVEGNADSVTRMDGLLATPTGKQMNQSSQDSIPDEGHQ